MFYCSYLMHIFGKPNKNKRFLSWIKSRFYSIWGKLEVGNYYYNQLLNLFDLGMRGYDILL